MSTTTILPNSTLLPSSTQQSNMPTSMFYQAYQGQGHSPALILTVLLLNCVSIPGFFMNFSVVFVTFRHRALHGSANFLLALTSFFEMGHEAGHLLFLWIALSGQNFLPYWLAFRIMAFPIFCIGAIFSAMVSTGLDRLLCVLLPHFHSRLHLPAYLFLHCLFCGGIGAWLLANFWQCAQHYPDYPVTGYVSDMIIGECGPVYTYSSMAFNIVTIGLYLVVGFIIRWQSTQISKQTGNNANQPNGTTTSSSTNQRLFRSLAVIIVANIGGYFYVSLMRAFVIPQLRLSSTAEWYFNSYDGILLNVSSAINAPVLYFLSKDYRTAFDKELVKLNLPHGCRSAGIVPAKTLMVSSTKTKRQQQMGRNAAASTN